MTNLIDLGFTLLIIFMIATPLINQEQTIPVDLPVEQASTQDPPDPDTQFETITIRADGTVEQLGDGGMPVGLFDKPEFSADQTTLGPGDKLVFFSDGVTECADPSGRFLEDDELANMLSACGPERGARFLEAFQGALRQFAGGAEMGDDVSVLAFDYEKARANI